MQRPMRPSSENDLQVQIVRLLNEQYPHVFFTAHANGTFVPGDRRVAYGMSARMKKAGQKAGIPDLQIIEQGRNGEQVAWVELKFGQQLSANQRDFHQQLMERGHVVVVISSVEQFERWLVDYLPPFAPSAAATIATATFKPASIPHHLPLHRGLPLHLLPLHVTFAFDRCVRARLYYP